MLDAGVSVSLGGDSGNGSNHFDMLRLMYLTATVSKDARLDVGVMGPERVLEMATLHGAEALLLGREIGSIERGKRADLVLYDLDTPEWRPPAPATAARRRGRPAASAASARRTGSNGWTSRGRERSTPSRCRRRGFPRASTGRASLRS